MFSPARKQFSSHQRNRQIFPAGCWHKQRTTIPTSTRLRCLPKKHVRRKPAWFLLSLLLQKLATFLLPSRPTVRHKGVTMGGEMDAEELHDGDASRHSPCSSAFVRIVIDRGRGLAGVHESAESVLAERRIWSTIWTSSSTAPWRSCWILIMEVEQRMTIALFLLKLPIDPLKQIWTMANQSVEHACTPQKIHPKISHIIKGFPLGQYLVDF
jgi:hypothetical protein